LSQNNIGKDGGKQFIELLTKENSKLEELYLSDNALNHDAIVAFYDALTPSLPHNEKDKIANSSLRKLDIARPNYNSIMQETASHCHKMLRSNTSLEYLNLTKHKLRHDGI